jgi:hypothetical protein
MFKKNHIVILAAVLIVGALAFFSTPDTVYAQDLTPEQPAPMRIARGLRTRSMIFDNTVFIESIAAQTGISVEELQSDSFARSSVAAVLSAAGYDDEAIQDIFETAVEAVLAQALADGTITAEQADMYRSQWQAMGGERLNLQLQECDCDGDCDGPISDGTRQYLGKGRQSRSIQLP